MPIAGDGFAEEAAKLKVFWGAPNMAKSTADGKWFSENGEREVCELNRRAGRSESQSLKFEP